MQLRSVLMNASPNPLRMKRWYPCWLFFHQWEVPPPQITILSRWRQATPNRRSPARSIDARKKCLRSSDLGARLWFTTSWTLWRVFRDFSRPSPSLKVTKTVRWKSFLTSDTSLAKVSQYRQVGKRRRTKRSRCAFVRRTGAPRMRRWHARSFLSTAGSSTIATWRRRSSRHRLWLPTWAAADSSKLYLAPKTQT